jgi:hypothetical protein
MRSVLCLLASGFSHCSEASRHEHEELSLLDILEPNASITSKHRKTYPIPLQLLEIVVLWVDLCMRFSSHHCSRGVNVRIILHE